MVSLCDAIMNSPSPEVIYTHESDLDGLLSGLLLSRLARNRYGHAPKIEAFHNNQWRVRTLGDKVAWVADFAFEKRLDRPGWMIVDHHPAESAPQHARLVHDLGKSSGLLCYELLLEEGLGTPALERLVQLNNISDLFLHDDPEFDLACDYASLVKCYGFWNVSQLIEGDPERLLNHPLLEVTTLKRRVEDPLGYAWSRKMVEAIGPGIGLVPTVVGNANLIVHRMLSDPALGFSVLVTLLRKGNGMVVVSLRSRGGQALPLALKLQGGGHPNAAGATLPRSIASIGEASRYLRQQFSPKPSVTPADLEQAFGKR